MKVTLDTIFGEVTEEYPESEDVLRKYLGEAYCLTCPGKMFDTIGNGVMLHGLPDEAAQQMVKDLQEVVDRQDGQASTVEADDAETDDKEEEEEE